MFRKSIKALCHGVLFGIGFASVQAIADVTISEGLTLRIPEQGQTNWYQTIFSAIEAVSAHDHTGNGNGKQIQTAAIANNAVTGDKIRLDNNVAIRARNQANTADVDLLKLNSSDQPEFAADLVFTGVVTYDDILITGGSVSGITDLAVADGGTGASTAADARTNLDVYSTSAADAAFASEGANFDITSINGIAGATIREGDDSNISSDALWIKASAGNDVGISAVTAGGFPNVWLFGSAPQNYIKPPPSARFSYASGCDSFTTDRAPFTSTNAELYNVLCTLIDDLRTIGMLR